MEVFEVSEVLWSTTSATSSSCVSSCRHVTCGVLPPFTRNFRTLCFRETTDTKSREPSIPASTSTGPDPDKPPAHSESALVPLARAEEDDEMMEDVAEMAGGRQMSGQDALANLEVTLKPVEKYAVRFLEEVSTTILSVFLHSLHADLLHLHGQHSVY